MGFKQASQRQQAPSEPIPSGPIPSEPIPLPQPGFGDDAPGRNPAVERRQLGHAEWVALPEFGIFCMKANLSLDLETSRLMCEEIEPVDLQGTTGWRFRVYPITDDSRTFIVAEAPAADRDSEDDADREPVIRTILTIGELSWSVGLRLVPRQPGVAPLSLGRDGLFGRFAVDRRSEHRAGLPAQGPPSLGNDLESA